MDDVIAPNVLLSFLWASLDNVIPAAFWTLAFLQLPEQKEHLAGVQQALVVGGALEVCC